MARRPQKPDEPSLLDQLSGPLRDFVKDFQTHGKDVLEKVRQRSPEKYLELSTKLAGLVAALRPEPNGFAQAKTREEIGQKLLESIGMPSDLITEPAIQAAMEVNDTMIERLNAIAQDFGWSEEMN